MAINFDLFPSPCYVVDEALLEKNLKILKYVQDRTDCKILLATKAFSMYSVFNTIGKYLYGVTSSSLNEARLGYEEMGKEVHIFSPAYRDDEFDKIIEYCDHIVFNSFNQWKKYKNKILAQPKKIQIGLRINPEYSEIKTEIYNPCAKNSRLGITLDDFKKNEELLDGIDGIHFHTMCEQGADVLERTVKAAAEKFGGYLKNMKWLNFGGGHHITKEGYDLDRLIRVIDRVKEKYNTEIYLEPGEAVALNSGFLISTVLDVIKNGIDLAVLDVSAACHMPDVLEMPYRPEVIGAGEAGEFEYSYRLTGPTCLAGDIIGDYSFKKPLKEGDRVIFCDMAIYSMVKNNTFNGINLPSIALYSLDKKAKIIKTFGYDDFKRRL